MWCLPLLVFLTCLEVFLTMEIILWSAALVVFCGLSYLHVTEGIFRVWEMYVWRCIRERLWATKSLKQCFYRWQLKLHVLKTYERWRLNLQLQVSCAYICMHHWLYLLQEYLHIHKPVARQRGGIISEHRWSKVERHAEEERWLINNGCWHPVETSRREGGGGYRSNLELTTIRDWSVELQLPTYLHSQSFSSNPQA